MRPNDGACSNCGEDGGAGGRVHLDMEVLGSVISFGPGQIITIQEFP